MKFYAHCGTFVVCILTKVVIFYEHIEKIISKHISIKIAEGKGDAQHQGMHNIQHPKACVKYYPQERA